MSIQLTRAFCLGVERQHITDAQLITSSKNACSRFLSRMKDNDFPSIIKPKEPGHSFAELSCDFPFLICFAMLALEA